MNSEATAGRCRQVKTDGTACQATARTGASYCFFHDPEVAAERTAARRAGGLQRSQKAVILPLESPDLPLRDVADVAGLLAITINQVRRGQLDPRVANAVGYLSGILLKAIEIGGIEERLATLEQVVRSQPAG